MKSYVVKENTNLRDFTDNACAQASFCFRALLKAHDIRVNGVKVGENLPLRAGDEVTYYLTPAQENRKAFSLVYEDDNIIIIDKESGVNAEAVYSALSEKGETYFVHRLDRNTEGLMVFARTNEAYEELLWAFRDGRVEKIYHALVFGRMPKRHSVEEAYLEKDAVRAQVRVNAKKGEKIVTEYEVMEEKDDCSLLKVTLHTGKTHQIRAHLAFLGHPVVGDNKYGDHKKNALLHVARQRLLAKELALDCGGCLAYLKGKRFISQKNINF